MQSAAWFHKRERLRTLDLRFAPRSGGAYVLPSWMTYTCSSSGLTAQQSAATVASGYGANAARAESFDASGFGLLVEADRSNLVRASHDMTAAAWTIWTGFSGTANSADVVDPSGGHGATKLVYDGSDSTGDLAWIQTTATTAHAGETYTASMWIRSTTSCSVQLSQDLGPLSGDIALAANVWTRVSFTQTAGGDATLQFAAWRGAADNLPRTFYVWGCQTELGHEPTSVIPTTSATVHRTAGVLAVDPAELAPGGRMNLGIMTAPKYSSAEIPLDHDLFYLDANNRGFLRASDHKAVFRIGGADLVSSALTWSRHQDLYFHFQHRASGRLFSVAGATTGNGSPTPGAPSAPISLPGTAYLLGNSSGAQESARLRRVVFCGR